jgi:hypothetical protein
MKLDLHYNSICSVKQSESNIRDNKLLITKFYIKYQVLSMHNLLSMISEHFELCILESKIISYELKLHNKTVKLNLSEVSICLN